MSPLDDELRALFHRRADVLAPAADPMAGIELRAKRMRRNRVTASVAGTALAVAAIAVAVPLLRPASHGPATQFGTPGPSAPAVLEPSPSNGLNLDPQHPWAYRGDKALIAGTELTSLRTEWARIHPGSSLSPLFGQVYEPTKKPEIAFVATSPDGDRWGVATTSEAGWGFSVDEPLSGPTPVLMAALTGDKVPRLIILASPRTGQISYARDGANFQTYPGLDVGVVFVPLEGDTSHDAVQVLDGNGNIDAPVFTGPAPDAATNTPSPAPGGSPPANALEWAPRGAVPSTALLEQATAAFATSLGAKRQDVEVRVLYAGTDKANADYVFLQAWIHGEQAHTFGFVSDGKGGGEPFLGPVIAAKHPVILAFVIAFPQSESLVLIAQPGVGPFSYATSATAAYQQVGNGRSDLNNVAVIDRDARATSDRIEVLAGDGMQVLYRGALQPLLCGATSCG
jgi:hypothetical protein